MTDDDDEEMFIAISMTEITMGIIDTVVTACQQFNPGLLAQYVEIADIKLNEPVDPDSDGLAREVIVLGQIAARALITMNSTMEAQVRSSDIFDKAMARYMMHKQAGNN